MNVMSKLVSGLVALLLVSGHGARAQERPPGAVTSESIESCVDTATIRFGSSEPHALLDQADTAQVAAALIARYPLISQDGFEPSGVVLWRKPDAGWVYVALLANPDKPAQVCFTATFAAGRFELTAGLMKKYFGIEERRT